ncbi:MAG: hypothetical protein ACXWF8_08520 [Methylobacter sp.]
MRFAPKLPCVGVFALAAALILPLSAASPATFNFVYIEASEGNSSGGHAAIQFDDDIYHYQHVDSGLTRLFRQEKNEFHFLYRYLQNRPMHIARIEADDDTVNRLRERFKSQFLTQERQFKLLDDLLKERIFIRHLLYAGGDEASALRLKGVGLFYNETQDAAAKSPAVQSLRQKIEQRYGTDFLLRRRLNIEAQIKALRPSRWPDLESVDDNFAPAIYSFTEHYSDLMTALFALKALSDAQPLRDDALVQMHQPNLKISEAEKPVLQDLRNRLEASLIKALNSNRPDWGYAVLVNLARHLAVDASLQSGYWTFVDDFADDSERLNPDQYLGHSAQLRALINDAEAAQNRFRQSAASQRHLSEAEYSQIEMAANRHLELLNSERRRTFCFNGEKALPSKSITFPDGPVPELTPAQLSEALSKADELENRLFAALQQNYRYDLLGRNCVTELFRTIDKALLKPGDDPGALTKESEQRLGGYIDASYNFIPFVAYQSVLAHYRVTESRDLDSYRRLELAKLTGLIAAWSESNIISSSLYWYNPDDSLFVFFTDDNVLLRPLFGVVNTGAGISQSLYGLFSWPWDAGKNLKSGATGILMSLPELAFFNMRKGSYKYLSFKLMED